mgnify:CR=1 FL=1
MNLTKRLATAGTASRRKAAELIKNGEVTVNGKVETNPATIVSPSDKIRVSGSSLDTAPEHVYIMLNKPAGYITTMSDPQGRPCVADLVPADRYPGLYPLGRLDMDTTGLLLFTTDGDMGPALLHPKHHVDKTYRVKVKGKLRERDLTRLRAGGLKLPEGYICAPAKVRIDAAGNEFSRASITIHEGRKRQVKLMFSAIGHPVVELHRDIFGPINLGGLPQGTWRELTEQEIAALKDVSGLV